MKHITTIFILLGTSVSTVGYGLTTSSHQAAARAKEPIISKYTGVKQTYPSAHRG